MKIINTLLTKIKNTYNGIMRPLRKLSLVRYMDRPVILFRGKDTAEQGGIYIAKDYNGIDNVVLLQPLENDGAFTVPVWASPTEFQVYSLDGEYAKLTLLGVYSRTIGRL